MKFVTINDDIWWATVGIPAADAAAVCNLDPNVNPIDVWWRIVKMRKIMQLDQVGEEWHKFREGGIGSSDVPFIMRLSDYKSIQEIFREKAQKKQKQNNLHYGDTADTARGKLWEPKVRELYQQLYGWDMQPVCVIHDKYEWARASLDGLRQPDNGHVLEIKCPRSSNFDIIKREGKPHDYWVAQVAYQCWVTEAPTAHLVVFDAESMGTISDRLLVFDYERDKVFEEAMLDRLQKFWYDFVMTNTPPPRGW